MRVQRHECESDKDKKIVIVNVLVNLGFEDGLLVDGQITQEGLERLITKVGEQISGKS
jgi:hypothetical protein